MPDAIPAGASAVGDERRIRELARLTAGADMWTTVGHDGLGLPTLRLSDGPNGVRGPSWDEREPALCTPCGTGLAASWDVALLRAVGELVGMEAKRQDVQVVLGPMINLHRSPLGGRGFECYSEDPFLSGYLAAAWIDGIQGQGVAACPKHLVANDSETARTWVNCIVDERALREIYLVPFEIALRSGAWALMAAYNRVNGVHATEHGGLIRDVVKGEWGWDGVVVSDWSATHNTVNSALAGLDLEMPGPPVAFGDALAAAVIQGRVPRHFLEETIERLQRLARRTRDGGRPERAGVARVPEDSAASADDLLTRAAADGFVLLKNERATLPLDVRRAGFRLAVIGPNAVHPCYQGGGSAEVNMRSPHSLPSVLTERFGAAAILGPEPGCSGDGPIGGLHGWDARAGESAGVPPLQVQYMPEGSMTPAFHEPRRSSRFTWVNGVPGMGGTGRGQVRVITDLEPVTDGKYTFFVRGSGATQLLVDDSEVAALDGQAEPGDPLAAWFSDEWGDGAVELRAGTRVRVLINMRYHRGFEAGARLEFGCRGPEPTDLLRRAVDLAESCDAVLLVVGTARSVESESTDRASTSLPGAQDELVNAVLQANPDTVVVINAGAAVDLPWADAAPTILYSWLPGDAFAPALAAVLAGDLEPGGRLPITLAADPRQYPAYNTTPDADGALRYTESIFVGYRHLDATGQEPAFCFGHGLGYTEFGYDSLELSAASLRAGEELTVRVVVINLGDREGKEVVQLYVSPPGALVPRPPRELKAFATLQIAPGKSAEVVLRLDQRAFSYWSAGMGAWTLQSGRFGIHVGRSSRDLRLSAEVDVRG